MHDSTLSTMFSSKTDEWPTPQDFFSSLSREFLFLLDPCALASSAKCDKWFGPDHPDESRRDGLVMDWVEEAKGGYVFMNPPYGRGIGKWVAKAHATAKAGTGVVCLLPARTDTAWFHEYCIGHEVRFIRGRLKFGGSINSAPFPSILVVMESPHALTV